ALVDAALRLGFSALELEYRLSDAQYRALARRISRGEVSASSVHNPLPRPPGVSPFRAYEERARLSSLDPEERRVALRLAFETLARAEGVGAAVAVFHLGSVDLAPELDARLLGKMIRRGERSSAAYEDLRERVAAARKGAAPAHRDAVLGSLDRLAREAERRGVVVGLENRVHPEEIPDRADLELIFRELRGAALAYWHDAGHASSLILHGFLDSPTVLLEAFREQTAGFHLHDAKGLDDHKAPGEGDLDFAPLAPFAQKVPRLVLEVQPGGSEGALREAPGLLARLGFPV
ncbi:MAG: sugar phosphate isomerase/epimerase, partial [Deltaproteobacteria bacterium]|nr:sugar phosphate isomerase/epimerase [Deltaproteobacteria bacterium]